MSNILIIDDDPIVRRLLSIILAKANEDYHVRAAESLTRALTLMEEEMPDIIVLDVMMPDANGFEICEKFKSDEKYKNIPILFNTSLDRTEDMVKGFRAGADDYITKPINADEVRARVKVHLRIKKAEAERLEAENMRTLNNMVVTLNHNMNQPMMAAYTYINASLESLDKNDKNRKNYGKVKEELDRLNVILRKIQSLDKVERTEYVGGTEMLELDKKKQPKQAQASQEFPVQLKQVAKMAALGEFSAAVVHTLNQPLMAISAHIEGLLMTDTITFNRDLKNKIQKIKDQFTRLSLTVKSISDYSKKRFAVKTNEDINESIKDSLYLFEQQLKDHNVEFSLDLDEKIPKTYIDKYQIQDVIINLLVNARDAIDDVYHQEIGGEIRIVSRVLKDKEVVMAGVIDNGKPVTEGTEKKIFESFFTTKDASKGTGLGLAVCRDVLKEHNGLMSFAILADGKKVFYFVLPLDKDKNLNDSSDEIHKAILGVFNDAK